MNVYDDISVKTSDRQLIVTSWMTGTLLFMLFMLFFGLFFVYAVFVAFIAMNK